MRADWLVRASRCVSLASAGVVAGGLLLPAGPAAAMAAPRAATAAGQKVVSYRGYRFEVPVSWPVLDLAGHQSTCVRFDLHAVYLGEPGSNQQCPSWLLGATETVVIQPGPRTARRSTQENPVADRIKAQAPGIVVTATFDKDPALVFRILASGGLAAPLNSQPDPPRPAAAGSRRIAVRSPVLPAAVADDTGLGFDACAAPSAGYLRAWMRRSPYTAVGIYIGGRNLACDQQNLTPRWVRREAAAGWRFVPLYAGPQASLGQLTSPASQGTAAAKDAARQAELLGFGPGTPLYDEMAAYPARRTRPALRFLSAWTVELHKLGFASGVYGSSDSAVADLAREYEYRTRKFVMPDVVDDALWNGSLSNREAPVEPGEWTGGRLHQFSGNVVQTYGGATMYVNQDSLDVTLPAPGGTTQASPGATEVSGSIALFYEGSNHHLLAESAGRAGQWARTDLGGYLTSAPSVVRLGARNLMVFYRGRGGVLWWLARTGSRWTAPRALTAMGELGSAPRAVAQPNGVIDVFWAGSHDPHLWHAQFSPGRGWAGPQNLKGELASAPYPVETGAGVVQVFWKGTDGNLWRAVRGLGQSWTAPRNLGMGRLGSAPRAVALPGGEIDVFWRGSTSSHAIWMAEVRAGKAAAGLRPGRGGSAARSAVSRGRQSAAAPSGCCSVALTRCCGLSRAPAAVPGARRSGSHRQAGSRRSR